MPWKLLFAFMSTLILLVALTSYLLSSEELFFDFYAEQLAYERILEIIDQQKKWQWVGYAILPIIYLVKFFLITCVLLMGTFLIGLKTRFKDVFKITIAAEFIIFVPLLMKLIWFGFINRDYTLLELMNFAPLSLDNVSDLGSTIPWLSPILKSSNLFELSYWLLLAYGLHVIIKKPFKKAFGMVVASYGLIWVVWQVLIIFLMINFTP